MPQSFALVTAPDVDAATELPAEPVDLTEAKAWTRVEQDFLDDDELIRGLIRSAREILQEMTGRLLLTQTWDLFLDGFPVCDQPIYMQRAPAASVTSISYVDEDGAIQVLASDKYKIDLTTTPHRILPAYDQSWPTTRDEIQSVTVRAIYGYGKAKDVPEPLKSAIKLLVGHYYEHREDAEFMASGQMQTIPRGFKYLIAPFRVWGA